MPSNRRPSNLAEGCGWRPAKVDFGSSASNPLALNLLRPS